MQDCPAQLWQCVQDMAITERKQPGGVFPVECAADKQRAKSKLAAKENFL